LSDNGSLWSWGGLTKFDFLVVGAVAAIMCSLFAVGMYQEYGCKDFDLSTCSVTTIELNSEQSVTELSFLDKLEHIVLLDKPTWSLAVGIPTPDKPYTMITIDNFISLDDSEKWEYYVDELPKNLPNFISKGVVSDAINDWNRLNPDDLNLVEVNNPEDASILITWTDDIDYPTYVMGLTDSEITEIDGQEYWYSVIQIDLVDEDCNGDPMYWSPETLEDTVKHEIGHAIGIQDHSSDPFNIMYDEDDGKDVINDWGYILPKPYAEYSFYVDEEIAVNNVDRLYDEMESELARYGYTLDDWENDTVDLTNVVLIERVNEVIERLNIAVDKSNCFLAEQ
jgi:hypothetical protein